MIGYARLCHSLFFPKLGLKPEKVVPQLIFTSNLEGAREVIDFLVRANGFEAGALHMLAPRP
jgi:hypothetical protein